MTAVRHWPVSLGRPVIALDWLTLHLAICDTCDCFCWHAGMCTYLRACRLVQQGLPAAAIHTLVLLLLPPLLVCAWCTVAYRAVCPPGTYGSTCIACPAGSFCPGGATSGRQSSQAPVVACPVHMTSPLGAASAFDCRCIAGYGGPTCQICKSGSFSEGGNRTECESCAAGQISIEGAPNRDYCSCPPGQGVDCIDCPRGMWGAKGVCALCPNGTTSNVGATGPDQCFCPLGTYGADCAVCLAGSYCVGGKEAPIQACVANRYSNPRAKVAGECFCAAGEGVSWSSPC